MIKLRKLLLVMLIVFVFAIGFFSLLFTKVSYASNEELLGDYAFSEEFINDATNFVQKRWDDNFYSEITMNIGEDKIFVDGVKYASEPATKENGELYLPIADIAKSLKYEVKVNKDKDATIKYNGNITTHRGGKADRKNAEQALNIEIREKNGKITIRNNYQLKQLLVRSRELNLSNTYGAIDVIGDGHGFYMLQYSTEEQARQAFEKFCKNKNTIYAEPNVIVALPIKASDEDTVMAADSLLTNRWGSERIGADLMKDYLQLGGKTSQEFLVAVADTGIDHTHPFLSSRVRVDLGWNFVGENANAIDLVSGHGTHVAGTIVDCTPSNVKLIPMKVLRDSGGGSMADCIMGTRLAAERGAKVINLSLGGPSGFMWEEVIRYVNRLGATVVVAAGNDSWDTKNESPANADSAITVAATGGDINSININDAFVNDTIASFSNFGDAVDIAAPGVSILSCIPGKESKYEYSYKEGTSMAAPHVTAGVAMISIEYPAYTPLQLKQKICEITVDCGTPGWDIIYGAGILDFRVFFETTVDALSISFSTYSVNAFYQKAGSAYKDTFYLIAKVEPAESTNKSLTYTTSNANVATVDSRGVVSVKGIGTATITAITHNGITQTCLVTVTAPQVELWIEYAAKSFAGGDGTAKNPYKIATAEQLAKIAFDANVYRNAYSDTYFELIDDIDLAGKEWYPICVYYNDGSIDTIIGMNFSFNGNYYSIKNMKITESITRNYLNNSRLGLFGSVSGVIKNLAVTNADTYGAIICSNLSGAMENCYGTGNARTGLITSIVGAFVSNCFIYNTRGTRSFASYVLRNSVVNNCFSYGDFVGDDATAIISGFIYHVVDDYSYLINCFSAASVNAKADKLTGFLYNNEASIINCYYLDANYRGVVNQGDLAVTGLQSKPLTFFQDINTFTNASNWDLRFPWDFDNVWGIDPNKNNGFPHIKGFYTALQKEIIQNIGIDFVNEQLTGFVSGGTYLLNGQIVEITGTTYRIPAEWFGESIQIIKVGNGITLRDSKAVNIQIPARPEAPVVDKTDCTFILVRNGTITNVSLKREYRLSSSSEWIECTDTSIANLTPGTYDVRFKASGSSFVGEITTVVIDDFDFETYQKLLMVAAAGIIFGSVFILLITRKKRMAFKKSSKR